MRRMHSENDCEVYSKRVLVKPLDSPVNNQRLLLNLSAVLFRRSELVIDADTRMAALIQNRPDCVLRFAHDQFQWSVELVATISTIHCMKYLNSIQDRIF